MTTLAMLTTIIVALITAVIGPLLMTWIFIRQKVGAIGLLLTDYLKTKK